MEIQEFLTQTTKGIVPLATLTTIAADRRAFGDDVLAAFRSQIEQRSTQGQAVLDAATTAGRDTLLASEQRSYDTAIRERDAILGLQRHVEQRTEQRAHVPATQTAIDTRPTETADLSPVLTREQRCSEYLTKRGGFTYQGERGAESMRFGAIVRALALGDRRGLSEVERRALAEGTDSAGGFTVPEILGAQFIDRVRNAARVMQAGAQTVPMTSDVLHLARLAQPGAHTIGSPSGSAANWKTENEAINEGILTLERVTFTARTLPMLIKLSVELSEDSSNIDAIIEREMSAAMALELDRAALLGSGTPPEPKGIINQQDNVDVGALNAAIDYDALIDACAVVAAANHRPTARLYNSDAAKSLAKLRAIPTGVYLEPPAYLDPVTEYVTNQIASDGGSPNTSSFVVGDFSQLMVGLRTSFRLEVSRQAADATSSAFTTCKLPFVRICEPMCSSRTARRSPYGPRVTRGVDRQHADLVVGTCRQRESGSGATHTSLLIRPAAGAWPAVDHWSSDAMVRSVVSSAQRDAAGRISFAIRPAWCRADVGRHNRHARARRDRASGICVSVRAQPGHRKDADQDPTQAHGRHVH